MKLFLDDERSVYLDGDGNTYFAKYPHHVDDRCDRHWIIIRDAKVFLSTLAILRSHVTEISLDHDLGDHLPNGSHVLNEIEKWAAYPKSYDLRKDLDIRIHSANPVGRDNMKAAIESIKRLMADGSKEIFVCKYCGLDTYIDPSDQEPPVDYCHHIVPGEN